MLRSVLLPFVEQPLLTSTLEDQRMVCRSVDIDDGEERW